MGSKDNPSHDSGPNPDPGPQPDLDLDPVLQAWSFYESSDQPPGGGGEDAEAQKQRHRAKIQQRKDKDKEDKKQKQKPGNKVDGTHIYIKIADITFCLVVSFFYFFLCLLAHAHSFIYSHILMSTLPILCVGFSGLIEQEEVEAEEVAEELDESYADEK